MRGRAINGVDGMGGGVRGSGRLRLCRLLASLISGEVVGPGGPKNYSFGSGGCVGSVSARTELGAVAQGGIVEC